jgi:hypothetical protein
MLGSIGCFHRPLEACLDGISGLRRVQTVSGPGNLPRCGHLTAWDGVDYQAIVDSALDFAIITIVHEGQITA